MAKKMKRILTLGSSIVLGGMIVLSAALANANTTTGYEELKTTIKNMAQVKSFTGVLNASIKDNGKVLAEINAGLMTDEDTGDGSVKASISSNGTKEDFVVFKQDGKMIFKSNGSETYNVAEEHENSKNDRFDNDKKKCDPEAMAIGEKIMDFVVGDLKNQVEIKENDGEKIISMNLSEKEIPTIANLIASLAVKEKAERNPEDVMKLEDTLGIKTDLKPEMPRLVDDVRIENVKFKVTVGKDGIVKNLSGSAAVAGNDEKGTFHKVEFDFTMSLSNVNSTVPEKIDLTGKQVKNVDLTELKDED